MAREFKTGKNNRTTYKYYIENKVVAEVTPDNEETEILIAHLHQLDDEEFDANRREKYKAPRSLDSYASLDDDAESRNHFLADNTYNPSVVLMKKFEEEERAERVAKIRELFENLDPKLKDIVTKVHIEKRTRVDVAAEMGVSEAMIRKYLVKVRDIFEKEFK